MKHKTKKFILFSLPLAAVPVIASSCNVEPVTKQSNIKYTFHNEDSSTVISNVVSQDLNNDINLSITAENILDHDDALQISAIGSSTWDANTANVVILGSCSGNKLTFTIKKCDASALIKQNSIISFAITNPTYSATAVAQLIINPWKPAQSSLVPLLEDGTATQVGTNAWDIDQGASLNNLVFKLCVSGDTVLPPFVYTKYYVNSISPANSPAIYATPGQTTNTPHFYISIASKSEHELVGNETVIIKVVIYGVETSISLYVHKTGE